MAREKLYSVGVSKQMVSELCIYRIQKVLELFLPLIMTVSVDHYEFLFNTPSREAEGERVSFFFPCIYSNLSPHSGIVQLHT